LGIHARRTPTLERRTGLRRPWLQLFLNSSTQDRLDGRSAQACGSAHTTAHRTKTVLQYNIINTTDQWVRLSPKLS